MPPSTSGSQLLDARLGRYAMAAGAFLAAAAPTQAAPITVLLPSPVDVRVAGYNIDFDQNGSLDVFFSGSGSAAIYGTNRGTADFFIDAPYAIRKMSAGEAFGLTAPSSVWSNFGSFLVLFATVSDYYVGIRFASTAGAKNRVGFAQFNDFYLYGFAWEEATEIRTFDLRQSASAVPEPGTGALAALALGALALGHRKRKQA